MVAPSGSKAQQSKSKGQKNPDNWPTHYPLATDTAQIIVKYGDRSLNLGLWLDHFISWTDRDGRGRKAELQPTNETKRRKCPPLNRQKDNELILRYAERWLQMLQAYASMGFEVRDFSVQPLWRIVVGLGAESVLETSIRLHSIYGIPIIPGSAIKGLVRAYAELILEKSPDNPELVSICGTSPSKAPLEAGKVVFFDAVPSNLPRLKLDVMNPHYGEYYRGGNMPPADYLNPVPVYFLTVEKGSKFSFAVASSSNNANLAKEAECWLKEALIELGIGAKTTTGYGQME